jgi:Ca-activated chloride channel family protein
MKAGMWDRLTGGTCRQCDRWLTDALAGELDPARQAELDAHLAACAACRANFAARRRTWDLTLQALRADAAPPSLPATAHEAIREAMSADLPPSPPPPHPGRSREIKFMWMEIAASVAIVGMIGMIGTMAYRSTHPIKCLGSVDKYPSFREKSVARLGLDLTNQCAPACATPESVVLEIDEGDAFADDEASELMDSWDEVGDKIQRSRRAVKSYGGSMARKEAIRDDVLAESAVVGGERQNEDRRRAVAGPAKPSAQTSVPTDADDGYGFVFEAAPSSPPLQAARSRELSGREAESGAGEMVFFDAPAPGAAGVAADAPMASAPAAAPAPRPLAVPFAPPPPPREEAEKSKSLDLLFSSRSELASSSPAAPPIPLASPREADGRDRARALDTDGNDDLRKKQDAEQGAVFKGRSSSGSRRAALARKAPAAVAEKDRILEEKYVKLEATYRKIKKEMDEISAVDASVVEKLSTLPEDAPLEDRYAALEYDFKHAKKGLDEMLSPGGDAAPMPPPLSETTFPVDAAMWRLLGGGAGEVRNYLVGKEIQLDEGADVVRYDAASGRLTVRHGEGDAAVLEGVITAVRATAEAQRELRHGLPFIRTEVNPTSTFSIDVDTASYALARRYLRQGQRPPPERVRAEEFVNAFDYAYRSPENALFAVHLAAAPGPFRAQRTLFRVGVQGQRLGADAKRPSQFTLLIDTSGSMGRQDRIGLARRSVSLLLEQLRPEDRVSVLACGYRTQVLVPFVPASERRTIERLVAGLRPQGEADLERGIVAAYRHALENFQAGAGNRVIIFTDGIVGFGSRDADAILAQVEAARRQGVTNTVVGFGGDGDDDLLKALAARGDGNYSFLNDERDARQLFEKEFSAKFHEIARDVKLQVEFNPALVAAYRQVGYEKRQLSQADFRNDQVDAGEVGAGQSVTALYELDTATAVAHGDTRRLVRQPLATVRIRYRRADTLEVEEREFYLMPEDVRRRAEDAEPSFRLAATVAEFAENLRYPDVPGIASPTAILALVERLAASDYRNQPDVQELLELVRRAR